MRKNNILAKLKAVLLALLVSGSMLPVLPVSAASSYTVTFRPGEVGVFTDAEALAGRYESGYAAVQKAEVTAMGAVKLTVTAGSQVPVAPQANDITADADYFVRNTSEWGPEPGAKVTKNMDFVVDYGKLVNGVEYTITYVDVQSGESIAPPSTGYGNVGETREYTAPTAYVNSEFAVYALAEDSVKTIVLSENAADNVISFAYTNTYEPGSLVVDNVTTVGGGTVEEIVDNIVYLGGDAVPAPQGDGGAPVPGGAAQDAEVVDIPDDPTPLDQGPGAEDEQSGPEEDASGDAVTIPEQETPLAPGPRQTSAGGAVIAAAAFGVAAVAVAAVWLQTRRRKPGDKTK